MMKMYEKLWKEFEKSPQVKKEKETLGESVVAVYEESILEQEEIPKVNIDNLIKAVLNAVDTGLKNLGFDGLDSSENPTALDSKKTLKIMVPVDKERGELAEYIKEILEEYPEPYTVRANFSRGNLAGYTLKLKNSNIAKFVLKPKRGSGVHNIGDVSEGLLAAALAVKFIVGDKMVSAEEAEKILNELDQARDTNLKSPSVRKEITKRVERNDGTVDEINLVVALTKRNFEDLMNPKKRPSLKGFLQSAVDYANSGEVEVESVMIMTDKEDTKMKIVADGISGQKETKIDVRVIKDGKEIEIGKISLKAGSTKQLGQIGKTWEALVGPEGMFPIMFGVTPAVTHQKRWYEVTHVAELRTKENVKAAAYDIYFDVYEKIKERLEATDDITDTADELRFFERLAKGTRYQATLEEEGVRLIQLYDDGSFKVLDFSKLEDVLEKINLGVKIQKESPRDKTALSPKIIIYDTVSDKPVISMRVKTENEGKTIRHYVEKEDLLTDLLNVAKKD
jgi:hypothetical protein